MDHEVLSSVGNESTTRCAIAVLKMTYETAAPFALLKYCIRSRSLAKLSALTAAPHCHYDSYYTRLRVFQSPLQKQWQRGRSSANSRPDRTRPIRSPLDPSLHNPVAKCARFHTQRVPHAMIPILHPHYLFNRRKC